MVEQLFLAVPQGCLRFVIVVFPDHTHLLFLTLTLAKVISDVTQYPLHHVTYAAAKFEVATFNGLGEDAFTRNTVFDLLTLILGSRSQTILPSTLFIM